MSFARVFRVAIQSDLLRVVEAVPAHGQPHGERSHVRAQLGRRRTQAAALYRCAGRRREHDGSREAVLRWISALLHLRARRLIGAA